MQSIIDISKIISDDANLALNQFIGKFVAFRLQKVDSLAEETVLVLQPLVDVKMIILKIMKMMMMATLLITLISMRSSFSLHFMLVYSFATLFIFFWLMFKLQPAIFLSIEFVICQGMQKPANLAK